MVTPAIVSTGAVEEVILTTAAVNIVQVDWTSTSTKVSTAKSDCTCSDGHCLVCVHLELYY